MAERYSEEGEHQEEKQFCFPLTVDPRFVCVYFLFMYVFLEEWV